MAEKKRDASLAGHLVSSRGLIWNLAKNDIKKKFAGSYFGIVWAFVQPVITVLLYWFVFEFGLHQKASDLRTGIEIPFVMWLMAGLVPWFYFQEAMNGGTGVLVEYSYLVKKVVFQIDTLPVVKMISALFTHRFLCCLPLRCSGSWVTSARFVYAFGDLLFVLYDRACDGNCCYATGAVTCFPVT